MTEIAAQAQFVGFRDWQTSLWSPPLFCAEEAVWLKPDLFVLALCDLLRLDRIKGGVRRGRATYCTASEFVDGWEAAAAGLRYQLRSPRGAASMPSHLARHSAAAEKP